jgi:PAS domain S-box-containing protein
MILGNRSIRAYLTRLAAAVALPLVVLEVWNLHAAAEADSERARDQVLHLARVTASDMVQFLDGVKGIASGLAARPAVRALDPASCDPILRDLLSLAPRFANVVTTDLEGRVICSAVPAAQPARGVPGRFLNRLRGPDQLTVGVAAPGVVTGRWVVPLGVPLFNAKGDVAGAVVLPLDLVRLPSLPSLEGLSANIVVGFVAADGTVLTRSSEPERFVGTKLPDRIALQQKTGTADVAGIDGVARLQGFAPVPGTDWIAVASIPASDVFAAVKVRMVNSALILVAILLAALLLAVRWSRAIRDPIAAVADTARKIAAGNLAARAPVAGATEIADVATQLNRMLDSRQQVEAELRESEYRYRDLVESSHDLVCTHDLGGRLLSVNEAAVRLTGYPREALLRMNMADLLTSGSRDLFAAYLREIQDQGVASGVMRIRTARGESRWWEYRNTLRTQGVGAPLVRGMAHDITERKQAEDALRASEERFRSLTRLSADWYWEQDADLRFTFVSEGFFERSSIRPEDILGKHRWDFSTGSPVTPSWKEHRATLEAHLAFRNFEFWRLETDGTKHYHSVSGEPLFDDQGRFTGYRGTTRDITAHKRSEQKVREQRRLLARAQELGGLGYWEYEVSTGLFKGSPELRRMLDMSAELPPQSAEFGASLFHADDLERARDVLRAAAEKGTVFELETRVTTLGGRERILVVSGEGATDDLGRVFKVIGSSLDITERRHREQALVDAAHKLQSLSRRLVDAQETERRHLAMELHDQVGQNLTALSINLDMLAKRINALDAEGVRRLQDCIALLEATAQKVDGVLDDLRPALLDDWGLGPTVQWVADNFAGRTEIPARVQVLGANRRIDPHKELALVRIVQEALNNVAKHANARSVDVLLRWETAAVCVEIADDGIGFERKGERERQGLGLLSMRERMQAIQGRLDIESTPGKGTRVCAWVPG